MVSSISGGDKINPGFDGYTYPIVDIITVAESDRCPSNLAYKLANDNDWLLEQDVIQAQMGLYAGLSLCRVVLVIQYTWNIRRTVTGQTTCT